MGKAARPPQLCECFHGEYRAGRIVGSIGWVENGPVSLERPSKEPGRPEELRAALLEWWLRTRGSPEATHWSLDQIVSAVAARDGVKQF